MTTARLLCTRPDGLPLYSYDPDPSHPSIGVTTLADTIDTGDPPPDQLHTHDFFIVTYFDTGGGTLRFGSRDWPVRAGDTFLIAPGDAVGIGADRHGLRSAQGRAVSFTTEALDTGPRSPLTWHTHPLLFPFATPAATTPRCATVPPAERHRWRAQLRIIDRELDQRRPGHQQAVTAALTQLLVNIVRLMHAAPTRHPLGPDHLVTDVLAYIDRHYHEPISLRDVARAVHLSPGHLTTVIGRKTGRTVLAWITHRRLAEARRLLAATDLAVEAVGRHAGFRDPSYFARVFRQAHGLSPLGWRHAAHRDTLQT